MKNASKLITRIILIIELVCPFIIATIVSFLLLFVGWEKIGWSGHDNAYFILPEFSNKFYGVLSSIVLFLVAFAITLLMEKTIRKKRDLINCVFLFLISFIVRLGVLHLIINNASIFPFSDFAQSWELANGIDDSIQYKSLFATWMNYASLEHLFISVVSHNYLGFIKFNCFVSSLSAPIVYGISRLIFTHDSNCFRISTLSAILYALYPSSILFAYNSAPDVYVVPLYLCAMLLIMISFKYMQGVDVLKSVAYMLVAGGLLGASAALKSFGVTVIIAFGITCTLTIMKHRLLKKEIILFLCCLIGLFSSYSLVKELILNQTEKLFNVELDYSTATPHYLLIGLNSEGEGQIHIGTQSRLYYQCIIEQGMGIAESKEAAYQLIQEDWQAEQNIIKALLLPKLVWAWQDDLMPLNYISQMTSNQSVSILEDESITSIASFLEFYYLFLMFVAIVGSIVILVKHLRNQSALFATLVVEGFFFIMLLSEAQSRYKYLIMPLVCVVSSVGLCYLIQKRITKLS